MIEKPCYICGGTERETIARQEFRDPYLDLIDPALNARPRAIAVCLGCGFVYHHPTLTPDEIATLYDRYRDTGFRAETPDAYFDRITSLPPEQSFNFQKVIKLDVELQRRLPPRIPCRVYDVGAGGGVFLKTFLDHASGQWEGYGVEPTPSYAELAGRRLGIPVISGMYRAGLFPVRFDLISIIKVLEHAPDPVAFLEDIRLDLLDDGLVYVEVPGVREVGSLPEDHDQLTYTHLYFYSVETFAYLVDRAGFTVETLEEIRQAAGDYDIVALLRKRAGPGSSWRFPLQDPQALLRLRSGGGDQGR